MPIFKKKGRDDGFPTECYANTLDVSISVGFNHIKLPRIGWIKTYELLPDNIISCPDNIKSGSIGVIKPEFSATNGTGL
ncbi:MULTISPECIES: hypothetical protein [unclassified Okeania]|uniref:hypothetical protein n=2 Tax=Okeania TaxID=1458928 RepID=UPI002580FACE|nr:MULTISPECIES: hypothetical protein [unclassified Okeania]